MQLELMESNYWEGAAAFEVKAYVPHPAGLQISLWTHPKMGENIPLSSGPSARDTV